MLCSFAYIYWDPDPEIFVVPILNWPILWYGVLFSAGFAIGFPIFYSLLRRYFLSRPDYIEADILGDVALEKAGLKGRDPLKALNEAIEGEKRFPHSKLLESKVKRCYKPMRALCRLALDQILSPAVRTIEKKTMFVADRVTVYMVVSTVIGARLGHFLFYERPSDYLANPIEIFRVWEGGLASHGAAIGIVAGMLLFSYRYRTEGLNWIRLLDYVCVPTAFAGGCIRLGNFINQEIVGTPTDLPWAVLFAHPLDHSLAVPRHPVQLYESLFYFAVFFLLWRLSYKPVFLLAKGRLIGLFLVLVFGFRFFIEFIKTEQSFLLSRSSELTMGQILSLPAVLAGLFFLFFLKKGRNLSQ
ncbi:MAG: prolipoprotein diacylglyceryl transferase [Verrucomicrobia bacterium]|nr:prolipoprotein diacylglyceryl transferase [Verrucomicrobiota bacterium]